LWLCARVVESYVCGCVGTFQDDLYLNHCSTRVHCRCPIQSRHDIVDPWALVDACRRR
jgi:hypothetical protein